MPIDAKLIVSGVLGVSLITVTALVIYYISKKDEDEEENKKAKSVKTSRVHVIEVEVSKKLLPALIGRNGSNIKEIQAKTGTSINFKRKEGNEKDICIIRGRTDGAQLAETLVHEFINNQPDIQDEIIDIPFWSCGKVIGTNGDTIKEIQHRSGARVKLDGTGQGETRPVYIRGTKLQILVAKEMIEKEVAQAKCRREISASTRTPRVSTPTNGSASPNHGGLSKLNNIRSTPERATPRKELDVTDSAIKLNDSAVKLNDSTVKLNDSTAKLNDSTVNLNDSAVDVSKTSSQSSVSGASMDVMVSAVATPARFWIQLVGPQVAQLDALVQQLTDYYENEINRDMHKLNSVREGSIVACVFRVDGRWYRGRVARILDKDESGNAQTPIADVFFVDYGDSEYVSVSELFELRSDFLKLKFQALECFLAGIKPAKIENPRKSNEDDEWDTRAIDRFEALTQAARWKTLVSKTMTYKEKPGANGQSSIQIPGVKLFDVSDGDGEIDIGEILISEGWAERDSISSGSGT